MKIGIFTALFHDLKIDEVREIIAAAGIQTVELSTGACPGSLHLADMGGVQSLIEDEGARKRLLKAVKSAGLTIDSLSIHENPLHLKQDIAAEHHEVIGDQPLKPLRIGAIGCGGIDVLRMGLSNKVYHSVSVASGAGTTTAMLTRVEAKRCIKPTNVGYDVMFNVAASEVKPLGMRTQNHFSHKSAVTSGNSKQLTASANVHAFSEEIAPSGANRYGGLDFMSLKAFAKFGNRVLAAIGLGTNTEPAGEPTKLGGNGPIMANALPAFDLNLTAAGPFGSLALAGPGWERTTNLRPGWHYITERAERIYAGISNALGQFQLSNDVFPKSDSTTSKKPLKTVILCSRADHKFKDELKEQLAPVVLDGFVCHWDEDRVPVGARCKQVSDREISAADVIVIMASPPLLASPFFQEQMPMLLTKRVVWVAVRACMIKHTQLSGLQCANDPERPIATLQKAQRDRIWVAVCERLLQLGDYARRDDRLITDQYISNVIA